MIVASLFVLQNSMGLARAAAGDLDLTFGTGGRVTTVIGFQDRIEDIAVQPDGKIIAVGSALVGATQYDFALARYNADGTLDATFGIGGKITTDFFGSSDGAKAVCLQSDGKIVVVGGALNGGDISSSVFALARYNSNGILDSTFGSGGKVTTDFSGIDDLANAVALQSDGKIIIAGQIQSSATRRDFALARYDANGSLDPTFGAAGRVVTDFFSSFDQAYGLAIQSDGRIVAAGSSLAPSTFYDFALARYDANGNLDPTFGTGGKVTTSVTAPGDFDEIRGIVIQSDEKIVAVGSTLSGIGNYDIALARYNSDGSLDSAFGSGGKVVTDFFGLSDHGYDVAIQFNGKIVAVGDCLTTTIQAFGVARYNTDGSLDSTFGSGGKIASDFSGANSHANAAGIQADGRIIAAGSTQIEGSDVFALGRYLGDTPPCSITCPSNITTSNTRGQCGALVNYSQPSRPGCGSAVCSPPPTSLFPVGTSLVTCAPASGPACTFNVTVVDTQAPEIICPASVTAVTASGAISTTVSFPSPAAADNCGGASTICNPPSGSSFPLGASVVNCTSRDVAGNTATCSFSVAVFDICLQDDSSSRTSLLFNSHNGDYRLCCSGMTFTGTGTVTRRGGIITLEHNTTGRRLNARSDQITYSGSASFQTPPGRLVATIGDRDARNSTCSCR